MEIQKYKPRVAVCICGFVRNFEQFYSNFFEYIVYPNSEHYIFDFFISTWDRRNTKNTRAYETRGVNDFSEIPINEINKIFNPKSILIEKFDDSLFQKYAHYKGSNEPTSLFSQFYKVKQCGRLLEDYIECSEYNYDFVIRTRFDILILKTIKLYLLDSSIIYLEKEDRGNEIYNYRGWISDKFAICSYKNFYVYSRFYEHLEDLIKRRGDNIPECLLYMYLEENFIPFIRMDDFILSLSVKN